MGLIDSIIHPEGTNFTVLFMICILFGFLQLKLTHRVTDQQLGQSAVDTMKSGNICKIDTGDSGQQVFFCFLFFTNEGSFIQALLHPGSLNDG